MNKWIQKYGYKVTMIDRKDVREKNLDVMEFKGADFKNLPEEEWLHFAKANKLHTYVLESLGKATEYALETGRELLAAKAAIPHSIEYPARVAQHDAVGAVLEVEVSL